MKSLKDPNDMFPVAEVQQFGTIKWKLLRNERDVFCVKSNRVAIEIVGFLFFCLFVCLFVLLVVVGMAQPPPAPQATKIDTGTINLVQDSLNKEVEKQLTALVDNFRVIIASSSVTLYSEKEKKEKVGAGGGAGEDERFPKDQVRFVFPFSSSLFSVLLPFFPLLSLLFFLSSSFYLLLSIFFFLYSSFLSSSHHPHKICGS